MSKFLDGTGLSDLITKIKDAFVAKADTTAVTSVSVDSTPTANSTNLVTSGGTYASIHPTTGSSQPSGGMLPNVFYTLGTLTGSVTISFASPTDANIENEYKFQFSTGTTAPTVTWPASITSWFGGSTPTINASKTYQVSVINGLAIITEF